MPPADGPGSAWGEAAEDADPEPAAPRPERRSAVDYNRAPEVVALREATARAAAEEPIVEDDPVIPVRRPDASGGGGRASGADEPLPPDAYDDEPPPEDPRDEAPRDAPARSRAPQGSVTAPTGTRPADEPRTARPATHAATTTTVGPRPGGLPPIERYGESVIREKLGARFVGEEELPPPAPVSGPGFEAPDDDPMNVPGAG